MPALPIDAFPFILLVLVVALAASAVELRAATQPPTCPRCVHCRHVAMQRRNAEEREKRALAKRLWGIDDADDDDGSRRP
jgi:hypothetical protein